MLVSVHALFSSNNLIGSKIIAKGCRHLGPDTPETSHVALLVNERWVHEATGHGVNVLSYDKWTKVHQEVGRVVLAPREYQEIADRFRQIMGKKYDYVGMLYLAFWVGLSFLGAKIPKKNILESSTKYFCCEVVGKLTGQYYGMSAPVQIFANLKEVI